MRAWKTGGATADAFKNSLTSGAAAQANKNGRRLLRSYLSRAAVHPSVRSFECQTSRICERDMEGTVPAAASVTPGARVDDGAAGERPPVAATRALKVMAAVDASEESLHALSWALDHVVRCHPSASLVVVHAQHAVDHFVYPVAAHGIAYAAPAAMEVMRKEQEENSRRILARALNMCKERQVDATGAILEGDAKEAICQAVEQFQAGLLVLGSRGLGRIKRAFLGSVSDYLSHHACCPVLVVKPTKTQAK